MVNIDENDPKLLAEWALAMRRGTIDLIQEFVERDPGMTTVDELLAAMRTDLARMERDRNP